MVFVWRINHVRDDFGVDLICDGLRLAESPNTYGNEVAAKMAIDLMMATFDKEFYYNHEANRRNLACPISNYFKITLGPNWNTPAFGEPSYLKFRI